MSYRCVPLATRLASALVLVGLCLAPAAAVAGPDRPGATRPSVGAKIEGDQYTIDVADAAVKVGATGAIVVTISPKAGFKFNEEFPTKLLVDEPPDGLSFPTPTLTKADGKLESGGKFVFRMPVVPSRAGRFTVAAKLKFSVCTADKCVVQRQALSAQLQAE